MELLIDSGNSRLKWAYSDNGRLTGHGSAARDEGVPQAAQSAWLEGPAPTTVRVANVAGVAAAQQLDRWVEQHWQQTVDYIRVEPQRAGVALAYAAPERFGVDRWLALIAAHRLAANTVAVIDAGTAVTLDVISADGKHQGGIIIPGLELMSRTLLQNSSGIQAGMQDTPPQADERLLGNDTRSCIEKGALYAVTGGIEHTLLQCGATASSAPAVIICGGNATQVMAELINIDCRHVPDLVLQGMQIINASGTNQ